MYEQYLDADEKQNKASDEFRTQTAPYHITESQAQQMPHDPKDKRANTNPEERFGK
jgi:hypothetical protein